MARRGGVRDFLRELVDDGDGKDEGLLREVAGRVGNDRNDPSDTTPAASPPAAPDPVPASPTPTAAAAAPSEPTELVDPFAEPASTVEAESASAETEVEAGIVAAAQEEAAVALDPPAAARPDEVAPSPPRQAPEASIDPPEVPTLEVQPETGVAFREAAPADFAQALDSDFDLDGIPDRLDADSDSDGRQLSADDDSDNDFVDDDDDRDSDSDGFSDVSESAALATARNPDGDLDGDGIRNEIDPDVDDDDIDNLDEQAALVEAARTLGSDKDRAIVDVVTDFDRDNDFVLNTDDIDLDGDGKPSIARGVDFDRDDVDGLVDRATSFVGRLVDGEPPEPTSTLGRAFAAGGDLLEDAGAAVVAANDEGRAIRAPGAPRDAFADDGEAAAKSDLDGDGLKDVADRNRDGDRFDDAVDLDDDNDGLPDTLDPDTDNDGFFDDSEASAFAEASLPRTGVRLSGGAKLQPEGTVTSEDDADLASLPGTTFARRTRDEDSDETADQVADVPLGAQGTVTLGVDGKLRDEFGRTFDVDAAPFDSERGVLRDAEGNPVRLPVGPVGGMLFDADGNLVDERNRVLIPVDELQFDDAGNVVNEDGIIVVVMPEDDNAAFTDREVLTFRGDNQTIVNQEGEVVDIEADRSQSFEFRPALGNVSNSDLPGSGVFVDGFGNLVDEDGERIGDVGGLLFDENGAIVDEDGNVVSPGAAPLFDEDDDFGSGTRGTTAPERSEEPTRAEGSASAATVAVPFTEEQFDDTIEALSAAAEETFGGLGSFFGFGESDDDGAGAGAGE